MISTEIGIDLGTANILVYLKGKGIVLDEPSVIAVDSKNGNVLAVGLEAKHMIGRTPGNISAIRPVKEGVIANYDYTQSMIKYVISKTASGGNRFFKRVRAVVCVPSGVTAVEERAVRESTLSAGAHEAYLIEEPMAAALGANIDVMEPHGNMVIDIGGGTTEVAIISLGGVVALRSIRVAGDAMDTAIINHVRRTYNLHIGERTAEDIKINIGGAKLDSHYLDKHIEIGGRDTTNGLPRTAVISAREICLALSETTEQIIDAVKSCLEKVPPELMSDIMDRGIILTGGGSLIYGLDKVIADETDLCVHYAEKPLNSVVLGTGKVLENFEATKRVLRLGRPRY